MIYITLGILIMLLVVVLKNKPKKYEIDMDLFNKEIEKLQKEAKTALKGGYGEIYYGASNIFGVYNLWKNNGKPQLFLLLEYEYDKDKEFDIVDEVGLKYNIQPINEEQTIYLMTQKSYIKYTAKDDLIKMLTYIFLISIGLYILEIIFFNTNMFNYIMKYLDKFGQVLDMAIGLLLILFISIIIDFIDVLFNTHIKYYVMYPFNFLKSLDK